MVSVKPAIKKQNKSCKSHFCIISKLFYGKSPSIMTKQLDPNAKFPQMQLRLIQTHGVFIENYFF